MTNAQHTPGPWKAITYLTAVTTAWDVVDAQGQSVLSSDDDKANARLIAAAPDMLKELETELVYINQIRLALMASESKVPEFDSRKDIISQLESRRDAIRATIAKATGN